MIELDTNVLVYHLTGTPPSLATKSREYFAQLNESVHISDLIVAETVYVLESAFGFSKAQIRAAMGTVFASTATVVDDLELLDRTFAHYSESRLAFADAYVIAQAEQSSRKMATFDKRLKKVAQTTGIEVDGP